MRGGGALRRGHAVASRLVARGLAAARAGVAAPGRLRGGGVLAFLSLPQDLDVLLPVLQAVERRAAGRAVACVTDALVARAPRALDALAGLGVPVERVREADVRGWVAPSLLGIAAVVTAAESSASVHGAAHALTRRANLAGRRTATIQHGLEHLGLTWDDAEYPIGRVGFASQTIFTWTPTDRLDPRASPEVVRRCVPVGCPKRVVGPPVSLAGLPTGRPIVAVFENLHWRRFDDAFRARFVDDLSAVAAARPAALFLVRPHPAGRWLTERRRGVAGLERPNVVVLDPRDPRWEACTSASLLAAVDAVVTTPSTVALDAARARRPVAVAAYGLDLPRYEPLSRLDEPGDWTTFVDAVAAAATDDLLARGGRFLAATLAPGAAPAEAIARQLLDPS